MASDIVEQLRFRARGIAAESVRHHAEDLLEWKAADEIERLRAEIKMLKEQYEEERRARFEREARLIDIQALTRLGPRAEEDSDG
jgi:hypothetical protein